MRTWMWWAFVQAMLGVVAAQQLAATGFGAEPTTLRGHQKSVADVEFSADGSRLASMSIDGDTIVWDLKSGTARHAPSLPRDLSVPAEYLKFTTETEPMLMAGCNSQGLVIHPQTLQPVSEWGDRTRLNAYSLVYAGGRRVVIRPAVKEAGKAEALFDVVDRSPILSAISPDGKRWFTNYLVPHGKNTQVQVLDAATGQVQCDLKVFTSTVSGIAWVDPNRVLTLVDGGQYGGSLMLWDVSGVGKLLAKVDLPGAWRLAVGANGKSAAVALRDNKVALIEIGEKQLKPARTLTAGLWSNADPTFSMSRDGGRFLAATAADSRWQLVVCDAQTGTELLVHMRKHDDTLPELSPDGLWVAVGHADGTISLLPVGSTDAQAVGGSLTQILDMPLEHPQVPGMPEGIRNLYRPFKNGRVEVSRSGDVFVLNPSPFLTGRVSIAQAQAGAHHWPVWEQGTNRPEALELPTWTLLSNGTLWVEGKVVGTDQILKYFTGRVDPATGQYQLQRQSRSGEQFLVMQPSPDGTRMAVRVSNWVYEAPQRKQLPSQLMLLDTQTGKPVRTLAVNLNNGPPCRMVFSSSGQRLAVLENWKLRVFDVSTGDEVPLAGEWGPVRFWFLDGGQILVREHSDGSIIGIDLETQAEVVRWQPSNGQTGQVTTVEFTLDGKLAAVGGFSGDLTIRDPRTGAVLHRLKPFELPIGGLGFSADGTVLAAADQERRLVAWKVGSFAARQIDDGTAAPREIRAQNLPGS